MTGKGSPADIVKLFDELKVADLQYREFTPSVAAKLKLAGTVERQPVPPTVVPATPAPVAPAVPVAVSPPVAAASTPLPAARAPTPVAAAPRDVSEFPLTVTFERLRRQVTARAGKPSLQLDLPPRFRASSATLQQQRQRALTEVFARLLKSGSDPLTS